MFKIPSYSLALRRSLRSLISVFQGLAYASLTENQPWGYGYDMQFNDSIAKEPQWVRGQWMQPSLTTLLQIAYAKLTANSDLIKHYHEDSGIHFGLLTLYTMASSSTFTTCTKWVTQPYFNPSSHGLTWSSGRPTAICFWPMLTSNLSHCLRNPGKVLQLAWWIFLMNFCQPNTNM